MKNDLENEVKKTRNQYASPPKGNAIPTGPLSDFLSDFFYKIKHGEGVPGPLPHAKLHGCGFKNVGLQASK